MNDTPRRVQLSRKKGWRIPENTVVVSRPSPWGNRYRVGITTVHVDGRSVRPETVEEAVGYFEEWLDYWMKESLELKRLLFRELRGRNLACWCSPAQHCHTDVLLRLANEGDDATIEAPASPLDHVAPRVSHHRTRLEELKGAQGGVKVGVTR